MGKACSRVIISYALKSFDAPERGGQKIVHHGQLADLRVEFLDVGFVRLLLLVEDLRRFVEELFLLLCDLVRVNLEAGRQFHQCLLSFQGLQCHLRLEYRSMVPSRSLCHDCCSPFT